MLHPNLIFLIIYCLLLQKWPGLPRGVKFDPSDEEVLWHLLAEIGEGEAEPHPFIGEFIISLDDNAGFAYSFPHKLPGSHK